MNKIFIEGVCGTGKTTILNSLSKKMPAFTIPELPEFNRSLLSPFTSEENIKYNFQQYIKHEIIRESIFSCSLIQEFNYVIADRSYFSIIALALSMIDYIGKDFIKLVISNVIERIKSSLYYTPNKVLILVANYDTIYKRIKNKPKTMSPIWFEESRIKPQVDFYNYLIDHRIAIPISTEQDLNNTICECETKCQCEINSLLEEDIIYELRRFQQRCL